MTPPTWTLRLRDFRVFAHFDWSPEGVCLLGGSNGAGKTTVLDALLFLRTLFSRGHEAAFKVIKGTFLRRLNAPAEAPLVFELKVGDVRWVLRLPVNSSGLESFYGEELHLGDQVQLRAAMYQQEWFLGAERRIHDDDEIRCCAKVLWDEQKPAWLRPFFEMLNGARVHKSYVLGRLCDPWQRKSAEWYLHGDGSNLWTVLDTWKGSKKGGAQYDWVLARARKAFPDLIEDINFVPTLSVFRPDLPDPDAGLPPERMADGLLTGLLHLTAVAGAQDGSVLAFDEVENHLHPHAIRVILAAMRELAEARNLTIILTTHSPVVMNEFKGHEDRYFVLERGREQTQPVALEEAHNPDWLAHFALGDLYEREKIAPQRVDKGR